jgi:hypothetical protein
MGRVTESPNPNGDLLERTLSNLFAECWIELCMKNKRSITR